MKRLILIIMVLFAGGLKAQVTVTDAEMPHSGDELYRTRAAINPFLNYAATGANYVWNFDNLSATTQDSAIYQTVASTNFVYALTYIDLALNPNRANHARPGVDIPFNNMLPITNPYTFFYRSASIYKAVGYGVELAGIPIPIIFTDQDEIYPLPIDYANTDTSTSAYNISLPSLLYYGYEQTRINEVDGWGSITTPSGTFDALRVKTTLMGRDTINLDSLGIGFSIDRPVVHEYKWLTPGYRVPVMQVNTSELFGIEIISDIWFYDLPRSIVVVPPLSSVICPGQAVDVNYDITGIFNSGGIFIPANDFTVQLSDSNGDFTNAVDIGSVTDTQSGTITCTVPANTLPGSGYRVRVVSSSPAFTGDDNGYDLIVGEQPVATAIANGLTEFCDGGSVVLSATADSTYSYQWQLDGLDLIGETGSDLTATLDGNYAVVVTNACGVSISAPITVVVNPLPEHTFSQSTYTVCDSTQLTLQPANTSGQSPLTYQWYLDSVLLTGETNDSISGYLQGNYSIEVTNSTTGCIYTATASVIVEQVTAPVISITGSSSFCAGDSTVLSIIPDPGISYQWQLNGIDIAGADSSSISVSDSGVYTVVATTLSGCVAVTDPGVTITVNTPPAAPVISTTGNTTFCEGDSAVLSVIAVIGFDYQWTLNGTNISGAIFNQYVVTTPSGVYSLVVTDMAGCSSEALNPVNILINPIPAAPVITQSNDTLYASGSGNLQWYLDGNLIPGATGNFYVPLVNGNYTVLITDTNTCENTSLIYPMTNVGIAESGTVNVQVLPNPSSGIFHITFPNAANSTVEYVIIDVTGKQLMNGSITTAQTDINLTSFARGIYFLKLSSENENQRILKLVTQ